MQFGSVQIPQRVSYSNVRGHEIKRKDNPFESLTSLIPGAITLRQEKEMQTCRSTGLSLWSWASGFMTDSNRIAYTVIHLNESELLKSGIGSMNIIWSW